MLKRTLAILATLMVIFPVVAGGKKDAPAQDVSSLEKIKAAGKIILGTSADYPPYEFHALIDGKDTIVGFDIELAKEIAKDLGVELEIKDMSFDGLLAACPVAVGEREKIATRIRKTYGFPRCGVVCVPSVRIPPCSHGIA